MSTTPRLLALPLAFATGCTVDDQPFAYTFEASDASRVVVQIDQGDVSYRATEGTDEYSVSGVNTARTFLGIGGESSSVEAYVEDGVLWVTSEVAFAGQVDVVIQGPVEVDVEVAAPQGDVLLSGPHGLHVVESATLEATELRGQIQAVVATNAEVELEPDDPGASALSTTSGQLVLALPYGGPYRVDVTLGEGASYEIEDLGFDVWNEYDTSFTGVTGGGTIDVLIDVPSGSFQLEELDADTGGADTGSNSG